MDFHKFYYNIYQYMAKNFWFFELICFDLKNVILIEHSYLFRSDVTPGTLEYPNFITNNSGLSIHLSCNEKALGSTNKTIVK